MNRENEIHTRARALLFRTKVSLLQLKRLIENLSDSEIKAFSRADNLKDKPTIAESRTPLWTESDPRERPLLAGKVHNLRLAVKRLNGLEIPAGEVFSFWKQVGQANRLRGYVAGRELREGCIIPSVGGGLCQLSNALYDAALKAGYEILERHAHTRVIAGSLAERGRDATIFWNHIDLRFKSRSAFRIEARLGKDYLHVAFKSDVRRQLPIQISTVTTNANSQVAPKLVSPQSCASCEVESCFRSMESSALRLNFGRTVFGVDEFSPEFDDYLNRTKTVEDYVFVPLDGKRFRKANYAWTLGGVGRIRQSYGVTIERSFKSRKFAAQGAARQLNLLLMSEKLAASYAESLTFDATHIVVQQNLLPFLWRSGALGGRTFDVLMTSLPMKTLQEKLDYAAALHPTCKTLSDFRAPAEILEAETEALENAEKVITPHTRIASLFGNRATLLDWKMPQASNVVKRRNEKFTVVFPASTVGRKGCYELREALRGLDVNLIVLGAELEGAGFWKDFDCEKGVDEWLTYADLVVLPAFVEHRPRRLLQAVANEIPVIASTDCGVENIEAIMSVEAGDVEELRKEITSALS